MKPARERHLIDGFVRRTFGVRGTLRLHRHAVGWDLLRAPVNILLSPLLLLARLLAMALRLVGAGRLSAALMRPSFQLRLASGRALEDAVRRELLDVARPDADAGVKAALLRDYLAARTAVAEICTTLLVLAIGFFAFRTATPGLLSLAPVLSDRAAQARAVEAFPLGQRLGGLWYGVFPVEVPPLAILAVAALLLLAASLVATFVGILADPVQAALGTHRRRLQRLIARLDAADGGAGLPREHLLARAGDLIDAAVSLIRVFRP